MFFHNMTAVKIIGLVFIVIGALLGFLNKKFASLSKIEDEKQKTRLEWIYKIIGLGLVVTAFIMILNS